jgi:signal transduction histidine kinase
VFETLCYKSIPSEKRIRERKEVIRTHYETRVIEDPDDIVKEISRLIANSNELSTCLTSGGMYYCYNHFFYTRKEVLEKQKKGEHKGIRYITNICQDNVKLVKEFLDAGIRIRHVKNLPSMSFGVSDIETAATIEKMDGGRMIQSLLLSNKPAYIDHFHSIFEDLWAKGIDAEDRIKDIDEGKDLCDIEIIQNPREGIERAWNYAKKSKHEILSIFPTPNAFRRQVRLGLLQLLKEATEDRGVQVKLLIPADENIINTINQAAKVCPQVHFRIAEENMQTRITIVLIDMENCLIVELKDDTKDSSYYAAGLATYSNSKSIISSYASIFESLWKQNEVYEQLKIHNKMQREFINVAAHELRTPVQPILSLTELLQSQGMNVKQQELLEVIIRNAKRLQRLTDDVLDVTIIEAKSLELNKEDFNLNDVLTSTMNDITLSKDFARNEKIRFSYNSKDILIHADKGRISQVISNLLDNAIKFTTQGTIFVGVEKDQNNNSVIVWVKDSGQGMDVDMLPRLFTRFASKSYKGTGLGLFISKGIIEAHGGKIWAENNKDGRGVTFYFSLPLRR